MEFILGALPALIVLGVIVFIIYYLPFLAKDSKKITESTQEINQSLKNIVKQNEEIIKLLNEKTNKT
ncbi:hypothetical protein [Robertmurraya korlensis]|uniref:hypothetical protein n=1 Tax=Robertmurraya korlensis TaxID=519977 RepID=UPI00082503CA|nr:hypothetical protein [Robertmurraya korlensis]